MSISANPNSRKPHAESGTIIAHQDVAPAHVVSGRDDGYIADNPRGDICEDDLGGRTGTAAGISQPLVAT
jgi:hypothetical protein